VADLEVTDRPAPADVEALFAGLRAFNEPFMGKRDAQPLAVMARVAGELVGGLAGMTARGFLHVDLLWVDAGNRGQGLGSTLLRAAEAEASRRGCHTAHLDTFDFQARPFYERHGYRVFAELAGYPGGHRSLYLLKRLDGGAAAAGGAAETTPPA
jgi:GNAT superfamily N-acetyltransferase